MYGNIDIYFGKHLQDVEIYGHKNYLILNVRGNAKYPQLNEFIDSKTRHYKYSSANQIKSLMVELERLIKSETVNDIESSILKDVMKCCDTAIMQNEYIELFWD